MILLLLFAGLVYVIKALRTKNLYFKKKLRVLSRFKHASFSLKWGFSRNITSSEITGFDPYREYNVGGVAQCGLPFNTTVLQAKTDEGDE